VDVIATEDNQLHALSAAGSRSIGEPVGRRVDCLLILREDPIEVLAGTLDARLFRVTDAGAERIETFDALEVRREWRTPWGGPPSVRSLAAEPTGWVYADIHVGSIMRSPDAGESWQPVTPQLHEDVHQVNTTPAGGGRVYANTAEAVYLSDDNGQSWTDRGEGLDDRYGRCITVSPGDADLVLATVSDGPHGDNVHGQLYRSEDAGRTWTHICEGFPGSTPENINTYHVAFETDEIAWALAGDVLHAGTRRGWDWTSVVRCPEEPIMIAGPRTPVR
jgi:photosystem II stability/assembly factor-like uncharacterized protein